MDVIASSLAWLTLVGIVFSLCSGESRLKRQVNTGVKMGDKALMWALKNGDLDEVKALLLQVRLIVQ